MTETQLQVSEEDKVFLLDSPSYLHSHLWFSLRIVYSFYSYHTEQISPTIQNKISILTLGSYISLDSEQRVYLFDFKFVSGSLRILVKRKQDKKRCNKTKGTVLVLIDSNTDPFCPIIYRSFDGVDWQECKRFLSVFSEVQVCHCNHTRTLVKTLGKEYWFQLTRSSPYTVPTLLTTGKRDKVRNWD